MISFKLTGLLILKTVISHKPLFKTKTKFLMSLSQKFQRWQR